MATLTTTTQMQPIFHRLGKYRVRIDVPHQGLLRWITTCTPAMAAEHGQDAEGQILDDLVRYTQRPFTSEENLLRQRGYLRFATRQTIHKN